MVEIAATIFVVLVCLWLSPLIVFAAAIAFAIAFTIGATAGTTFVAYQAYQGNEIAQAIALTAAAVAAFTVLVKLLDVHDDRRLAKKYPAALGR